MLVLLHIDYFRRACESVISHHSPFVDGLERRYHRRTKVIELSQIKCFRRPQIAVHNIVHVPVIRHRILLGLHTLFHQLVLCFEDGEIEGRDQGLVFPRGAFAVVEVQLGAAREHHQDDEEYKYQRKELFHLKGLLASLAMNL